jgi:Trypsin
MDRALARATALLRSSCSHRRLATVLVACVTALSTVLVTSSQQALAAPLPNASFDGGGPLVPYIIGGQESSISQFPWQVFVLVEAEAKILSCGGSILDETTILTAAHCVDKEGTTTSYPAGDMLVIAGASEVLIGVGTSPSTRQIVGVQSFRTDPYYTVLPDIKDDVAVLTLQKPLELSAERNTQAISLVPTGATPAAGTALSISGYGKENGAESAEPDGKLYATTLTAIGSDACRNSVGVNSAVLLCAESTTSSTCQGDSGGPLTEGSPAVQVGIVDFGPKECPVGQPDGFTNVAAPEVRAFIEGSESPPVAARPISPPVIKSVGPTPVALGPLTCEPGIWNGSPSFTYTFQAENGSGQVFQSGPGDIFSPPAALIGVPLVCIVQASNPGGVTTFRSGTAPAIIADTAVPVAAITALKCHLQACTLSFTASDPNGVALSVQPAVAYSIVTRCPRKKRKRGRKPAKRPVCHKTKTVPMSPQALSPSAFQAVASRLPYGERISFTVLAGDADGLKAPTAVTHITLLKPKRHKRKHRKR